MLHALFFLLLFYDHNTNRDVYKYSQWAIKNQPKVLFLETTNYQAHQKDLEMYEQL